MTDQTPDRLTQIEQRQQQQDATVAQIHEILLLTAQRYQESMQILDRTNETLDRVAAQQEVNTREIAELRAILRDRYGNGHTPE